jgi:uncharacterized protein (DUF362 family)/NAD-dependent dihydropyrimidine dehydrogenase PreA subunit
MILCGSDSGIFYRWSDQMERISLLKVQSYQANLQVELIKLVEPLGGMESFFKRGEKVLLKPNFLAPRTVESATTTHPAVILAMVTILKDLGCQVGVGDSPGYGKAEGVVRKLGLTDDLKYLGAQMIEFEKVAPVSDFGALPFERRFRNLHLAGELNDFDKIVNLPKLKTHGQMGLTLAVKNLFGCVIGTAKGQCHYSAGRDTGAFARLLLEIALTVNASLHILDGIVGMDGNGPSNGRVRDLNLLIAGVNPLAVDRVVLDLIQKKPEQFPIYKAAKALDLPGLDMSKIEVVGDPVRLCQIQDFLIPPLLETDFMVNKTVSKLIEKVIKQRLALDRKLCTKCRKCEEYCPAKVISFQGRIRINERKCIKCCCCQELCPVGALSVEVPKVYKLVSKMWEIVNK